MRQIHIEFYIIFRVWYSSHLTALDVRTLDPLKIVTVKLKSVSPSKKTCRSQMFLEIVTRELHTVKNNIGRVYCNTRHLQHIHSKESDELNPSINLNFRRSSSLYILMAKSILNTNCQTLMKIATIGTSIMITVNK